MSGFRERGDGDIGTRGRDTAPHSGRDIGSRSGRDTSTTHSGDGVPGWLRSMLFLDTAPRRMAHMDPHAVASSRHMARHERRSWLGALGSPLVRLLPHEPRRLEAVAMLLLVVTAALLSVMSPLASASAAPAATTAETGDPVADGPIEPADPSDVPVPTPDDESIDPGPSGPFTPWPSLAPTPQRTVPRTAKPTAKPVPRTFVALGDSLTAWPSSNPWPSRLDAGNSKIRMVHNAGVPGDTTAQMKARLNRDVFNYKPNVMFLLGGTNDLGLGYSPSTAISNLRAIIVAAKAHKITVIVLLVPPDSYSSMAPKIDSFNASLISLCNSQRVVYVDIHNPLSTSSGVYQSKYTSDGLHFNSLGAQAVANLVHARIKGLGL